MESSFLKSIEENKKLNKNQDWIIAINNCYKEIKNDKSRQGLFATSDSMIKDFSKSLKDKSKLLDKFGKAKITEATELFKEYIENE